MIMVHLGTESKHISRKRKKLYKEPYVYSRIQDSDLLR